MTAYSTSYEVDNGIIVEDESTGARLGLFVGGVLPNVLLSDFGGDIDHAVYFRSNGEIYRFFGGSPAVANNWKQDMAISLDNEEIAGLIGQIAIEFNEIFWMYR